MKIAMTTLSAAALLVASSAHGAALVYEPFADADSTLAGNTPGFGLTGTWSATTGTYPVSVAGGTATYGTLPTTGGQAFAGANPSGSQVNTNASVSAGSTLYDAGLLDNNSSLWFSFIYTVPNTTSTNSIFGFAIGTAGLSTTATLGAGQSAVGMSISRNNRPTASYWNNGIASGAKVATQNLTFSTGSSHLIVGQIIWGAGSETINLYLPGTDLVMPLAAYDTVTTSSNIDQHVTGYSVISFGGKNATATPQGIDEIRFGASYDDVIGVVPEPGSLALLGLGGLLIARRRRA